MGFGTNGQRKGRPTTIIFLGGLLVISWVVAMQVAGNMIDEQRLDSSGPLWQMLWFGGPVALAVLVYGLIWRALKRRALARAFATRGAGTAQNGHPPSVE